MKYTIFEQLYAFVPAPSIIDDSVTTILILPIIWNTVYIRFSLAMND